MDPGDPLQERQELLEEFETWTEWPMALLAIAWIVLLVLEFTGYASSLIEVATNIIWAVFILEFAVRLVLTTDRRRFLVANWLTIISLIVPAFRLIRVAAILRASIFVRGLRLARIVTGLNRGMRSWRGTLGSRRLPYVVIVSGMVGLASAAGIFTFEHETNPGFSTFGDALWWSGMMLITLGSSTWPMTAAGRVLAFLLGLYSFSVFGYVTAALASIFVEHDTREALGSGDRVSHTVIEEERQ